MQCNLPESSTSVSNVSPAKTKQPRNSFGRYIICESDFFKYVLKLSSRFNVTNFAGFAYFSGFSVWRFSR